MDTEIAFHLWISAGFARGFGVRIEIVSNLLESTVTSHSDLFLFGVVLCFPTSQQREPPNYPQMDPTSSRSVVVCEGRHKRLFCAHPFEKVRFFVVLRLITVQRQSSPPF